MLHRFVGDSVTEDLYCRSESLRICYVFQSFYFLVLVIVFMARMVEELKNHFVTSFSFERLRKIRLLPPVYTLGFAMASSP